MKKLFRSQPVLFISFIAAALTILAVPPDKEYIDYVNITVLIQLFALMTAVAGFRSAGIFERATDLMMKKAGTLRRLGVVLVLLCYISAMLVTNDVALLTFAPLTLLIYSGVKDERSRILTVVLETAAANMGSMMTPIGNPQNLYLYDHYSMTAGEFLRITLPTGLLSLVIILALTRLLPDSPCKALEHDDTGIKKLPALGYLIMFAVCITTVLRFTSDWVCLFTALILALIIDRRVLLKVDYALLATFVCFFVFVGNIGRIGSVRDMLSGVLSGREMMISAALSQVISNVPAAVMLSGFTDNSRELLLGVDIGGLGTIIASLASLISFQIYRKSEGAQSGRYMKYFSLMDFGMLAVLLGFNYVF